MTGCRSKPNGGPVMTLRLADFSIAKKIAFACLVPLTGLAIFAGSMVLEARQKAAAADEVLAATALAEGASLAVHELQRERGMSVGFVASKGAIFAAELPKQREETDRSVKAFHDAVGAAGRRCAAVRSAPGSSRCGRDEDTSRRCASASRHSQFPRPRPAPPIRRRSAPSWRPSTASPSFPPIPASCARSGSMRRWCAARNSPARSVRPVRAALPPAASAPPICAASWRSRRPGAAIRRGASPGLRGAAGCAEGGALRGGERRRRAHARGRDHARDRRDQGRGRGPGLVRGLDRRIDELKKVEDRVAADLKAVASAVSSQAASTLWLALAMSIGLISVASFAAYRGGTLDHRPARDAGRHHADARRRRHRRSRSAAATARTKSAAWRARSRCSATTRSSGRGWKRRRAPSRRSARRASAGSTR